MAAPIDVVFIESVKKGVRHAHPQKKLFTFCKQQG